MTTEQTFKRKNTKILSCIKHLTELDRVVGSGELPWHHGSDASDASDAGSCSSLCLVFSRPQLFWTAAETQGVSPKMTRSSGRVSPPSSFCLIKYLAFERFVFPMTRWIGSSRYHA